MLFPEYKNLDLPALCKQMSDLWQAEDTFKNSIKAREGSPSFVFFEGPPSANGMPGIHHVMARSIKDVICRYKTQKGYSVHRKAGWDTHGLPVELGVEKMLGITKEAIGKSISVEQYNAACRREVMKYTKEWEQLTSQMAYWVDMEHPYITYHNSYIETLWYLLKQLYDKGLLYKGYSIQPFSPAAGTGLSSHELNQPGCYKDVKDTTCTVQFEIIRNESSEFLFGPEDEKLHFIAWTTTPWTLPSNTALCVGPKIEYVKVHSFNPYSGEKVCVILAKALVASYFNPKAESLAPEDYHSGDKLIPYTIEPQVYMGSQLKGIAYKQLISWVNPGEGAFRVVNGDFVTTADGTGIVHIAPTFGEDDNRVGKANSVPGMMLKDLAGNWQPMVDRTGRFFPIENLDPEFVKERVKVDLYKDFAGAYVKNAFNPALKSEEWEHTPTLDVAICMWLKERGLAFRIEKHVHSYPHCWRTDKPVLYYPLDSWFIRTTAVKEKMAELNKQIHWHPESTGTGRFGMWLENIQDWNLSRSRFWGTPLPIWRTKDGKEEKCIGSLEEFYNELEKAAAAGFMQSNPLKDKGFVPGDFSDENYEKIDMHRPFVDDCILVSPSGAPMYREADLIDVWFDSGSMPFAQEGLVNKDKACFGQTADFIAEGVDQTRGWFYTLHAVATMINGRPAFKNVISNGLVLDKNGNKMSKRLGNAVDPFMVLNKYGADALRWYMLTNAQPWDNLKFDEEGVDEVRRKFFGTLYNTYSFFALYANVDNFDCASAMDPKLRIDPSQRPEIDRWILSLLNSLKRDVDALYNDYDITTAGRRIQEFVCDHLSNWYVRLNRKRFWGGSLDTDKMAAYQTLYECLLTVARIAAPIAPFFMDRLYRDLTPGTDLPASVHLSLMPLADENLIDTELEAQMSLAQRATSMVLALRRKVNIKVRQPLSRIMVPVTDASMMERMEKMKALILHEVNVKEIEYLKDTAGLVSKSVKPNFKVVGKRYGRQMKEIQSALEKLGQEEILKMEAAMAAGEYCLPLPSGDVMLQKEDVNILSQDVPGWLIAIDGPLSIALDIQVSDDLRREGTARELVSRIQNLRKERGLEVTDRILVKLEDRPDLREALASNAEYICSQTLAKTIQCVEDLKEGTEVEWEDGKLLVDIEKY